VIQAGAPVVFQEHPVDVVTATVVGPPVAGGLKLVGLIEYVHGDAWVTVTVCPPIVSVAVRVAAVGPVFAPAVTVIVPGPLPLVGVAESHVDGTPLTLQAQPAVVVTVTVPEPPAAAMGIDEGLAANVH
jgi:hypothetical protein